MLKLKKSKHSLWLMVEARIRQAPPLAADGYLGHHQDNSNKGCEGSYHNVPVHLLLTSGEKT